jgi:ribonucleoside-triphosphate reductase
MRNLNDIEKDLAVVRDARAHVEGTPAEVYSRIVGYYRSVRNWNRGKREEYGERRLYQIAEQQIAGKQMSHIVPTCSTRAAVRIHQEEQRLLLFVRPTCPACPAAKDAAGRLGIPVDLVNADTEEGLAEAVRRNVLSTPTAILLAEDGTELGRARDARTIESFGSLIAS